MYWWFVLVRAAFRMCVVCKKNRICNLDSLWHVCSAMWLAAQPGLPLPPHRQLGLPAPAVAAGRPEVLQTPAGGAPRTCRVSAGSG